MSKPRFEHGVARIGEQILAFGGFDASYGCLTKASFKVLYSIAALSKVDVWNPETLTWKPAGFELETGRAEFATVIVPEDSVVCSDT